LHENANLQTIRLEGNPLICDCQLLWLQELSANVSHLEASCDSPPELKGKNLKTMLFSQFKCRPPEMIEELNDEQYLNPPISLKCKARGDPEPSIVWMHNNNPIKVNHEFNRYSILNNGSILMIKEKSNEIEGIYQCIAKNVAGLIKSKKTMIKFSKHKTRTNTIEVKKLVKPIGTRFILKCSNSTDVFWTFNDSHINHSNSDRFEFMKNGSLFIRNLLPIDNGFFKCRNDEQIIASYKVRVSGKILQLKYFLSTFCFLFNNNLFIV
jgi:peroxidase